MSYKIAVNLPNVPKGVEVEIDGLGLYKNGSTFVISDTEAEVWRVTHPKIVTKSTKSGDMRISHEKGLTLLQAFDKTPGIEVSTIEANESDPVVVNQQGPADPELKSKEGGEK